MADSGRRQEIQSSLESIVATSESWLKRLRKREWHVRLATSFLTMILAFFIFGAVGLLVIIAQHGIQYIATLFQDPNRAFAYAGVTFLGGVFSGIVTFFILKRRQEAQLKEVSSLILEMKSKLSQQRQTERLGGPEAITGDALSLAEKIVDLLPTLVRKRNADSILFGFVALLIVSILGRSFAAGLVAGIVVWIYFRYETRKTYDQEIAKFEAQKQLFEKRKNDFMETL
jgi:Na+/proline symporter